MADNGPQTSLQWAGITVIIPTLNEAQTIAQLLQRLTELYPGINVIVADDGSTDGTRELVDAAGAQHAAIKFYSRAGAVQKGITASVVDALGQVKTPNFAVMDGDLQHPPEVIGELCRQLEEGAVLVSGARLPYVEKQGLHRVAMTRLATFCAKVLLRLRGIKVSDPMSGLFAGNTEAVRDVIRKNAGRFEPRGYKILFDIMRVCDARWRIDQVFYQSGVRPSGYSKLRPAHAFYFLRSLFK